MSKEGGRRLENHVPGGRGLADAGQSGVVEWADQRIQSCAASISGAETMACRRWVDLSNDNGMKIGGGEGVWRGTGKRIRRKGRAGSQRGMRRSEYRCDVRSADGKKSEDPGEDPGGWDPGDWHLC